MMKVPLFLLLPLALAACAQPTPEPKSEPTSMTPSPTVTRVLAASVELPRYFWRLTQASDAQGKSIDALLFNADKPVQLQFSANQLQVSNTCNRMSGGYQVNETQLMISPLASTQRACVEAGLMALDRAIGDRLQGHLSYTLDTQAPLLKLTTAGGDTLLFTGEPTPETRYGGPGETEFLEVAAQAKPCSHPLIADKQCLQVRKLSYDDKGLKTGQTGEFQNFYGAIDGYAHQAD